MQKTLPITRLFLCLFIILKIATVVVAADNGHGDEEREIKAKLAMLAIKREACLCWQLYAAWEKAALVEIYAKTDEEKVIAIENQRKALDAWENMQCEKRFNQSLRDQP